MHRRYYAIKAMIFMLAALTVGLNSGRDTRAVAAQFQQVPQETLTFVKTTASVVSERILDGLNMALRAFF